MCTFMESMASNWYKIEPSRPGSLKPCCHFSRVWLSVVLWTVAHQAPMSMGFSRQGHWSGLPFPSPGHLPNPRIKPVSLMSPALAGGFFTTSATWEVLEQNKIFFLLLIAKKGSGCLCFIALQWWKNIYNNVKESNLMKITALLLLSHFSRVRLCATPSLGFSRQEHWSGLPFPSPMHKSESEVTQSCPTLHDPHGLQSTRLLHPWDFLGKSTGVGCHCLLQITALPLMNYLTFGKSFHLSKFQCAYLQKWENIYLTFIIGLL